MRHYGEGVKRLRHPSAGTIAFEYSAFAVDGRPELSLVVYNPATAEDAQRIAALLRTPGARGAAEVTAVPAQAVVAGINGAGSASG